MKPDAVIRQVEDHRDKMDGYRTFPDGVNDALFARGEGTELQDAWQRADARFQRNNPKEIDPGAEAADLIYMIASTIIAIRRGDVGKVDTRTSILNAVQERLCYAITCFERNHPDRALDNLEKGLQYCLDLCVICGWNPAELLAAKAARDNAKFLPNAVTAERGA